MYKSGIANNIATNALRFFCLPANPECAVTIKKESVRLISLSFGGSGKPGTNKQYPTLVFIYKNGDKHPY